MITQFELRRNTREFTYHDADEIKQGCTLEQNWTTPSILKRFSDKEVALNALKGYKSSVDKVRGCNGTIYTVKEFYIEENNYDEEGNWIGGGDVWKFSEFPKEFKKEISDSRYVRGHSR